MYKNLLKGKMFGASVGVLAMVASLMTPAAAFAAISNVQFKGLYTVQFCTSPSTYSFSFDSNVTSGNVILVTAAWKGSSATIPTPTDSLGNTYTRINDVYVNPGTNSNRGIAMFYTRTGSSGADTITVGCPVDQGHVMSLMVSLRELSGVNSTVVRTSGTTTGSTDTVVPPSGLSVTAGDLFVLDSMTVNNRSYTFQTQSWTNYTHFWTGGPTAGSMGVETLNVPSSGTAGTLGNYLMNEGTAQWAAVTATLRP